MDFSVGVGERGSHPVRRGFCLPHLAAQAGQIGFGLVISGFGGGKLGLELAKCGNVTRAILDLPDRGAKTVEL